VLGDLPLSTLADEVRWAVLAAACLVSRRKRRVGTMIFWGVSGAYEFEPFV
jgi:hypothetical protein